MSTRKAPEQPADKKRKKTERVAKTEDEHLEGSYLLEETVTGIADQYKIKKNRKALEALFLAATSSYTIRVILHAPCPHTRSLLLSCLSKRVGGTCTFLDAAMTDGLVDAVRGAVKIACTATSEVFEGEVAEVRQGVRELEVTLRTAKTSSVLKVSPGLAPVFSTVNTGDVVYVDPAAGIVRRLGRAENHANEYDLECDKYVQLSKTAPNSTRCHETTTSLLEMDRAFSGSNEVISDYVRRSVDSIVEEYFKRGAGRAAYSLLVIDNAELLDSSRLVELNHLVEKFPWLRVIFVTNESKVAESRLLSKYLFIDASDSEDKLDILLARHPKLADQSYLTAASEYINAYSLDVLSSVIESCDTPFAFKETMMIF